jgi:ribokinase
MKSAAKIVVVGSCNMDIYAYADHLPEAGETVIGSEYWMGMGGKGANQAVAAARLGAESKMVGRMGKDVFGDQMMNTLSSYGVNCDFIQRDGSAGSGVALVIVDDQAENIIAVVPGTNMRITPGDVNQSSEQLQAAAIVMMQLEIPLDAIAETLKIARAGATLAILNPAPARDLPDEILRDVDILTPNQTEIRFLSGISAETLAGAKDAGHALLQRGVKTVIVTLGSLGALIVRPDGAQHLEGFSVDCIDTSGAGDAFMGGLGVGLAEGMTLEQATRFANSVGALSTTRRGAMPSMPSREEVEAFQVG